MYVLVVRFTVQRERVDSFDRLINETVKMISGHEPATVVYVVHRDPLDPLIRVIYECYRDEPAFLEHENSPHVQRFLVERDHYVVRPPEVTRLITTVGTIEGSIIDD